MKITTPNRTTRSYTQRLVRDPRVVFPLLCPVREADWIVGWDPLLVLSKSSVVEPDCVFTTRAANVDSFWYVTRHDPNAGFVEMIKITPAVTACRLSIQLRAIPGGSEADVEYTHTSLGPEGDAFVAAFTEEHFHTLMQEWESRLNHYLSYGSALLPTSATKPRRNVLADEITVRRATLDDAAAIADIYNEAILTTTATFDTQTKTVEERARWLRSHDDRHPVLVAVVDGDVVGWASLTHWSDRCAYADTAETSFYVKSTHRGLGIGRRLKREIVDEANRLGYHTLIARVAEGSAASEHLNNEAGFVLVGTLKEVGRKFGRLLDVHLFQKLLRDGRD